MRELEELENKIKEVIEEINKLKAEKKITKRWRANFNDYFYLINDQTDVIARIDEGYAADDDRYNIGNYFKTEEQAEAYKEKLLIYQQLKDLALELNNGEENLKKLFMED